MQRVGRIEAIFVISFCFIQKWEKIHTLIIGFVFYFYFQFVYEGMEEVGSVGLEDFLFKREKTPFFQVIYIYFFFISLNLSQWHLLWIHWQLSISKRHLNAGTCAFRYLCDISSEYYMLGNIYHNIKYYERISNYLYYINFIYKKRWVLANWIAFNL